MYGCAQIWPSILWILLTALLYPQEVKSEGCTVTFSLKLPADFPVGKYRVTVGVTPQGSRQEKTRDGDREMVVLFNPWTSGRLQCTLSPLIYDLSYVLSSCRYCSLCVIHTYHALHSGYICSGELSESCCVLLQMMQSISLMRRIGRNM